jgi:hypothetical protein
MPRRLAASMLVLAFCLAVFAVAAGKGRDRDHDRLPDKWEKRHQLSMKHRSSKRDPDHDRLSNLREYRAHTNPRRADTDGDGFGDGAEVRAGSDPRKRASHPRAGGCEGRPNTPDGPDPWGGCFPGPASTGVPDDTALTPYTGPCRVTVPNTVIDSKLVNCYLEVVAPNVQIRNSLVNGHVSADGPNQGGSFTITDSTVDAGPVNAQENDGNSAIGSSNFVATRVETVRGIRGVWCEYDCTIQDSYIHGQDKDEGGHAHMSGIRVGSGARQHIVHTSMACDAPEVPPDAGCSADLTGYGDFAPIQNNLIERNLFLWSTGGTCAYGGSTRGKPYSDGSNNVFRDNIFQRGPGNRGSGALGHCGYWSAITDLDAGQRGNQWINNRWDTGKLMRSEG